MTYLQARAFARDMRKKPTQAEDRFWQAVRNRQIQNAKFHRQYLFPYYSMHGRRSFYIVDFYCPARRLIVEIDGPIHDFQISYDEFRTRILTLEHNLRLVRFRNEEVLEDWAGVEKRLLEIM